MNETWKLNGTAAGLTFMSVATAASFWNANNPEIYKVREMAANPDARADLKLALAKSALEVGMLGLGATVIAKSWWPLAAGLGYVGISYAFFDWACRNPHMSIQTEDY